MRLALLGPADGHSDALERAARFVLEEKAVDRAVYLGIDGALDAVVRRFAEALVGENPSAEGAWSRAVRACLRAGPDAIDRHIAAERARERLRIFESLPDAETRVVEMIGGALVVMIYDKGKLNEEDMLPARLLLFGKGTEPVVKQVGPRWFLSPGSFAAGGLITLEDSDAGISLALFDQECREVRTEQLSNHRATKLRVGGAG
jgi:hypothetical protein